jgi:hypothetical protein
MSYPKIAKELMLIARSLTAFTPEELSYPYGKGPRTPWGKAQVAYKIDRGVTWYSTPGHGGLGVSGSVARKYLSPQAMASALKSGGSFWFEEDVDWVIPFYEVPKWEKILAKIAGGSVTSQADKRKRLERYFPQYFEEEFIEKSKIVPPTLKDVQVGDVVIMSTRPARFEIIEKLGRGRAVGLGDDGRRYRMPRNTFQDKVVEVIRKGKTIWKK